VGGERLTESLVGGLAGWLAGGLAARLADWLAGLPHWVHPTLDYGPNILIIN